MMESLRFTAFVLALIGTISWIAWALKYRKYWMLSIAPLSLLVNVICYYLYIYTVIGTPYFDASMINIWSTIIRLQGLILLSGFALMMIVRKRAMIR